MAPSEDVTAKGPETRETRLKRLRIRSWRRGMREMDLILGRFADEALAGIDDDLLAAYEEMLEENDQELFRWVSGQTEPAPPYVAIMAEIRRFSLAR